MSATVIGSRTRVLGSIVVELAAEGRAVEGDDRAPRRASDGDVLVEGHVEGGVRCPGQLTLGPKAQVTGEIEARDVRIAGVLRRPVRASGIIHLLSTAEVHGDLEAARVIIDDGAIFEGQVRLRRAASVAQPARHASVAAHAAPRAPAPPVHAVPAAARTPVEARAVPELSSPGRRRLQRRAP